MSGKATGWVLKNFPVLRSEDRTRKLILLSVADAANQYGEHARPGLRVVCSEWGFGKTTVIRHLNALVAEGWLAVTEQGQGRGHVTVYRIPGMDPERDLSSEEGFRDSTEKVPETELLSISPTVENNGLRANEEISLLGSDPLDDEFAIWWKSYPRKTAKKAARKAYVARRREGVETKDLLAAARRYANDRRGELDRFTLHPATFLGPDERWKDFLPQPGVEEEFDDPGRSFSDELRLAAAEERRAERG